jgi:poly(3-hydroxybutyrate) depolymerase
MIPEPRLVESAALPYLLSLPAEAEGLRPVLCFLHGFDEGAPTPLREGLTRHGPLAAGSAEAATRDFIVVAPQLPAQGDHWRRHAGAVGEIVRAVQGAHGGDPARTYLTGFSYGGNGVFDLALTDPAPWAALWAVDPTRVPEADPGLPVWLSSGVLSRRLEHDFVRTLGLAPPSGAERPERVITDQGEDHVRTAARAYAEPGIYAWLLARRRRSG